MIAGSAIAIVDVHLHGKSTISVYALAKKLGVSSSTIYARKNEFPMQKLVTLDGSGVLSYNSAKKLVTRMTPKIKANSMSAIPSSSIPIINRPPPILPEAPGCFPSKYEFFAKHLLIWEKQVRSPQTTPSPSNQNS